MTRRVQLAGVPDDRVADQHLGAAAGMPRQALRGPQRQLDTGRAADDAHRLEGVDGVRAPAWPPRARRLAHSGQHHGDVLRLVRQRRVEYCDLVVGGPAVVRNAFDGTGFRGRLDDLGDREQPDVDGAAGHVAPQGFQQPGQQRGRQLRAIGFQRVEHLRGRHAGDRRRGRPHWSNTPAGRNGVGRIST